MAKNPKVLVIASGNPVKVAEIKAILAPVELQVRQQPEGLEIAETGSTYLENARLKAAEVARICGHWALADDSGLEVDALGGAPGIYSARYAASDKQRIERLLEELKESIYRSAGFHSAVALADPFGNIRLEAEGICRGEILSSPRGRVMATTLFFGCGKREAPTAKCHPIKKSNWAAGAKRSGP